MLSVIESLGVPAALGFLLLLGIGLYPFALRALRAVWHRPVWAVVLVIVSLAAPWRTGDETEGLIHLTFADIGSLLLVVVVAFRLIRDPPSWRLGSWVAGYLAAIAVALALSTMFSLDPLTGLSGFARYMQLFVVVPVATMYVIESASDRNLILGTIICLGVFEAIVGISQYVGESGAGFGSSSIRATGTFGAFNIMAYPVTLSIALIVCAGIWLARPRYAVLMASLVALFTTGLFVSLSRGSWLATAAAVLAMLVVTSVRRTLAIVAASAVLVGAVGIGIGGPVTERLVDIPRSISGEDTSLVDRYALWEAGVSVFLERPILGFGPKSFAAQRDNHTPLRFSGGSDISDPVVGYRRVGLLTPHNLYVLFLVETGIVGVVAFITLFAGLLLRILSRIRADAAAERPILGLVALGWLIAFLAAGLYGDVGGPTMALEAVMLGIALWYADEWEFRFPAAPPTRARRFLDRVGATLGSGRRPGASHKPPRAMSAERMRALPTAHGLRHEPPDE